jgi:hypothetical protein
MKKLGWSIVAHDAVLRALCLNCTTAVTLETQTDACLCGACHRLMVDEAKTCIQDRRQGPLVLCQACYHRDARREDWEGNADGIGL